MSKRASRRCRYVAGILARVKRKEGTAAAAASVFDEIEAQEKILRCAVLGNEAAVQVARASSWTKGRSPADCVILIRAGQWASFRRKYKNWPLLAEVFDKNTFLGRKLTRMAFNRLVRGRDPVRRVDAILAYHFDQYDERFHPGDIAELMARLDRGAEQADRIARLLLALDIMNHDTYFRALLLNPSSKLIEFTKSGNFNDYDAQSRSLYRLLSGNWQYFFLQPEQSLALLRSHVQRAHPSFRDLVIASARAIPASKARERCEIHLAINDQAGLFDACPQTVEVLVDYLDRPQPVSTWASAILSNLERQDARDKLIAFFLANGNEKIKDICLTSGYTLCGAAQEKALYFFLSGRFDDYDSLDFERTFLRSAYRSADANTQMRIREQLKSCGRPDWMSAVLLPDIDIDSSEQALDHPAEVMQALSAAGQWQSIFELITRLPLEQSLIGLRHLCASDWTPDGEHDRQLYCRIMNLIKEGIEFDFPSLHKALPVVQKAASIRMRGPIKDMAFAPTGSAIALATGAKRVLTWNFQKASLETCYAKFERGIDLITFCGQAMIAAESSAGDAEVWLFLCREDEHDFLRNCGEPLIGLAGFDSCQLLTVTRSGVANTFILSTDLCGRPLLHASSFFHVGGRVRNVVVDRDGACALIFHDRICEMRLPELAVQCRLTPAKGTTCGVAGLFGDQFILGLNSGDVCVYDPATSGHDQRALRSSHHRRQPEHLPGGISYASAPERQSGQVLSRLAGSVVSIISTKFGFYCISSSGDIVLIDDANQVIGRSRLGFSESKRVTAARISADQSYMALGHADGTVSLCDLRIRDLRQNLEQPIAGLHAREADLLAQAANSLLVPAKVRNTFLLMQKLIALRSRFDIDISMEACIKRGDFDIELADDC